MGEFAMKIAICEDEIQAGLKLKTMVEASEREVVFYSDAQSFFKDWERGIRYDVVFTDIVMGDEAGGMELCRRIGAEGKVFLIIVTNYIEYAPEGYQHGVFRYLMKPVEQDALNRVLADVETEFRKNGKFVVNAFDGERVISSRDILYVEVSGRYLNIRLQDEQSSETVVMLMQSLKDFAANLPKDGFARINRNQLINLNRITLVKQGSVVLDSGAVLPVSRRQQKSLQDALVRCLA